MAVSKPTIISLNGDQEIAHRSKMMGAVNNDNYNYVVINNIPEITDETKSLNLILFFNL